MRATRRPLSLEFILYSTLVIVIATSAQVVTATPHLSSIDHIFSFGDSLTSTGYSPSNGVNNLTAVKTSSGGKTWIEYLAASYSSTANSLYNFAAIGGTVSQEILFDNGAPDFAAQVTTFNATFPGASSTWTSERSLFAVSFGGDNLYSCYVAGYDCTELQPALLAAFDEQITTLYALGALHFLILETPAIDRSPLAESFGRVELHAAAEFWNERLGVYATYIPTLYPGSSVTFHRTGAMFDAVLDRPASFGFKDSASACSVYASLNIEPNANDAACKHPLSEFFWKDFWHPSWKVQQLLALDILQLLKTGATQITVPAASTFVPTPPIVQVTAPVAPIIIAAPHFIPSVSKAMSAASNQAGAVIAGVPVVASSAPVGNTPAVVINNPTAGQSVLESRAEGPLAVSWVGMGMVAVVSLFYL